MNNYGASRSTRISEQYIDARSHRSAGEARPRQCHAALGRQAAGPRLSVNRASPVAYHHQLSPPGRIYLKLLSEAYLKLLHL